MSDAGSPAIDVVVAGGGTSGHVLPALAILEALVDAGHDPRSLAYVGAVRGVETRLVPPTGFDAMFLDVVGLQRAFSRRNLLFAPKLLVAAHTVWRRFGRRRPRCVVSVGGYASLPAVLAALLRRVPVVVVSYDRRPGRSSALTARFATAVAAAYPGSTLPRAVHTGAPVRRAVLAVDRATGRDAARVELGVPERRLLVAVVGGSLGSGVLNEAVAGMVESFAERTDVHVRHVVGERFLAGASPARHDPAGILYDVIGYEDRMPAVYAAADLLVTRAGASTIAELAAVGAPAVVVPWAGAAEDHQTDNARWLADRGAAVLLAESELDASSLAATVADLLADETRRTAIAAAAHDAGADHRRGGVVALVESVVGPA